MNTSIAMGDPGIASFGKSLSSASFVLVVITIAATTQIVAGLLIQFGSRLGLARNSHLRYGWDYLCVALLQKDLAS